MKILFAFLASAACCGAQITPPAVQTLWNDAAPGALGHAAADSVYVWPYPAAKALNTGAALIICAGGGYDHLAIDKEGHAPAQWFQAHGVTCFVLKYRLGTAGYHYPIEIDDGKRAMRWVRSNAKRFGVNPARIGMLGFSAGGHLASAVGTHFDAGDPIAADSVERQSCRPDFLLLVYAVITMDSAHTNSGTRLQLLGASPSPAMVALMSNEKHVTAQTPPAFLCAGLNDALSQNSQVFHDSCLAHGVTSELHLFTDGPHGFGLADGKNGAPDIPADAVWPSLALTWLDGQGMLATGIARRAPDAKPRSQGAQPQARNGSAVDPISFDAGGGSWRSLLGRWLNAFR